jgi:hypothetical protein
MRRDTEKRHRKAERVQRDAIFTNISKGSCSIVESGGVNIGDSKRPGVVK